MQFSIATSTFFALLLASISSSSPIRSRDVASCEVAASAEHVKCIEEAERNPAAVLACTATAVGSYVGCAGVAARDVSPCKASGASDEAACVGALPTGDDGKKDIAAVMQW
ncbi:hypothetical protein MBM_09610 [Drepanopeziza brunnea f. sp. 'multigermtubi' MB_m1]|uniref:Uncharacterized protein n=1 Tax=Marssonina brunnea f. sp. multigermtubi (strain MB_m1) TaxID=1072389 RepID=K1XIJ9_MARBU|nr:uncharacterized protein MBM_09610 [Drepanopeziza brunnea f. sp. 'multigermtubi' MB_m1]EKD12289.1 hypothetical protein MBM_09610 [Drepanopeziza brunnea f. sp. 'multigermtubi' MB_m1]